MTAPDITPFETACMAATAFVAASSGFAAARTFSLQPLDQKALDHMRDAWGRIAGQNPASAERHERYMACIYPYACHTLRHETFENGPPHLVLWHENEPRAVVIFGTPDQHCIPVNYVLNQQDNHVLKGKTLGCAHAAVSAYARSTGRQTVVYEGPFSCGSVMQIERGAIPISTEQRDLMWQGYSVHAPARPDSLIPTARHIPGYGHPPAHIDRTYENVYRRLFGRPYEP